MASHNTKPRQAGSGQHPSNGAAVLDYPETRLSASRPAGRIHEEVSRLVEAVRAGRLSERANASEFHGADREVLEGLNSMLDALVEPLNAVADFAVQISKGAIPEKITTTYSGDFNILKSNLNACIEGLGGLAKVDGVLQRMADNDYSSSVDGNYEGVFANIAKGVNIVLEDCPCYLRDKGYFAGKPRSITGIEKDWPQI